MRKPNYPTPKPWLTFRVGIAGTREPVNRIPGLAQKIQSLLAMIKREVGSVYKQFPELYSEDAPRLILISSLAQGADIFVAKLAAAQGDELQTPLAYPRGQYRGANFPANNPDSEADDFDRLIETCTAVLELTGESTEDASYDVAGSVLVSHSDVLIAVWDGGHGRGPGGTADSVYKAAAAGVPVATFSLDPNRAPSVQVGKFDSLKTEELAPFVADRLLSGLKAPHRAKPSEEQSLKPNFAAELRHLREFYGESVPGPDLSWPYAVVVSLMQLRLPGWPLRSQRKAAIAAAQKWRQSRDCATGFFRRFEIWVDRLAVHYANWMRGAVAGVLFLGVILVDSDLVSRLWRIHFWNQEPATALLTLALIAGVWYSNRKSVHRRWLQYRMTSERLKSAALGMAAGLSSEWFFGPATSEPSWVVFYCNTIIRSFGLGSACMDSKYISNYRMTVRLRVRDQYQYHSNRAKQFSLLSRRVRRLSLGVFSISVLGTILQLLSWLPPLQVYDHGVANTVGRAALALAIIGAAVAGFAAQENFARLAQVSGLLARRLDELTSAIDDARPTTRGMQELALATINEMMREHEDWYLLYSLRDIELGP